MYGHGNLEKVEGYRGLIRFGLKSRSLKMGTLGSQDITFRMRRDFEGRWKKQEKKA